MVVLAIDTTGEWLNLCLFDEKSDRYFTTQKKIGMQHSQYLVDEIADLQKQCPLPIDLLVVSSGPGSFTGVRISLSLVKGLAMGWNCDFILVPTLDVFAAQKGNIEPQAARICLVPSRSRYFFCGYYANQDTQYHEYKLSNLLENIILWQQQHSHLEIMGHISTELKEELIALDSDSITWEECTLDVKCLTQLGLKKYQENGPSDLSVGAFYLKSWGE